MKKKIGKEERKREEAEEPMFEYPKFGNSDPNRHCKREFRIPFEELICEDEEFDTYEIALKAVDEELKRKSRREKLMRNREELRCEEFYAAKVTLKTDEREVTIIHYYNPAYGSRCFARYLGKKKTHDVTESVTIARGPRGRCRPFKNHRYSLSDFNEKYQRWSVYRNDRKLCYLTAERANQLISSL